MNIRTKKIIFKLLNEKNVNVFNLAKDLSISARSIRNDINSFNSFLKENSLSDIKINSNGDISFVADNLEKGLTLLLKSNFYDYKLSKEERICFIIENLLMSHSFLSIKELSEKMYVSVTTISNDLKCIRNRVKKYNLQYLSDVKGISIFGKEFDKRFILLDLSKENEMYYDTKNSFYFAKISELIAKFENENNLALSDSSFVHLSNYLVILITRIRNNFLTENFKKENKDYLPLAKILSDKLEKVFSISLSIGEVRVLSYILSTLKYLKKSIYRDDIIRVQIITKRFIEDIERQIEINLRDDYLLLSKLSFHLETMLNESVDEFLENDRLISLEERYEYINDVVKISLPILNNLIKRKITNIEIKFIVLHICAAVERKIFQEKSTKVLLVSDFGVSSVQLLSQRLINNFGFVLVDIIPTHLINNYNLKDIDIVISTQNLNINFKFCVNINVIPNNDDYANLFKVIEKLNSKKIVYTNDRKNFDYRLEKIIDKFEIKEKEQLISEISELTKQIYGKQNKDNDYDVQKPLSILLPNNNIKLNVDAKNWQSAIKKSGLILLKDNFIEKRYIDSMIENVERNGSYIVIAKGVACAHAGIEDGCKKLGYSMVLLKEEIDFKSSLGPVFCVFCLSATDVKSHLRSFMSLTNMCNNKNFIKALKKCKTKDEVHKLIRFYE